MSAFDLMGDGPLVAAEQCPARSKSTGRQCGRMVRGGGVCHFHGGRAPQVAARREARIATAEARAMFGERYEPRSWMEALPAAAQTADQLMRALQDRVELSGELRAADLEALAQMAERVAKLAKLVQDSGLDERRVRVSEAQGQLVADVIRGALIDLEIDPSEPRVMRIVSSRLRALTEGVTTL